MQKGAFFPLKLRGFFLQKGEFFVFFSIKPAMRTAQCEQGLKRQYVKIIRIQVCFSLFRIDSDRQEEHFEHRREHFAGF